MARKGLPKKYAKMGFKKGWKAFKASKSKKKTGKRRKSKSNPKKKRIKRSTASKKPMARKKKFRKRVSSALSFKNSMLGAAGATLIEPVLDSFIPNIMIGGIISVNDLVKIGAGYMLRKKKGALKGFGTALAMFGARNLIKRAIVGFTGAGVATGNGLVVI